MSNVINNLDRLSVIRPSVNLSSLQSDTTADFRAPQLSDIATTPDNRPGPIPSPISGSPDIQPHLTLLTPLDVGQPYSARIMARLAQMEAREVNPHLADDYRIAWLTVLNCSQGIPDAWRYSFWCYLGKVPEKLIPEFVARAEQHAAMEPSSPRKPVESVPFPTDKKKEVA